MKRKVLSGITLTLLMVIFGGSSIIIAVGGHAPGVILSAWTKVPPTIDGTIDPTEWAPADTISFNVTTGRTCTLYVMNDATTLYLAVEIADTTPNPSDHPDFFFDNDHDGILEEGDDALLIWGVRPVEVSPEFWDLHYNFSVPGCTEDWGTPYANGTIDGSGDASNVAGMNYFEFSHPLDSDDDAHDFSLSVGDTVGFRWGYFDNGEGLGGFPSPPGAYGDIIIASPPVGGIYIPVNKLELLAPYIGLTILLAVAVTTVAYVKKRKRHTEINS